MSHTKSKPTAPDTGIPDDIQALLDATPEADDAAFQLRKACADLESNPEFVAGYLKAQFIEDILKAMAARGINRSQLAQKLGKSRQYVGRVLNESANFTLETLAEIACALDMRTAARMCSQDEDIVVVKRDAGKKSKGKKKIA